MYPPKYMKFQKFGAKSATADSCFGLIGPRQCSAALGGPATSTEDLRHQGALNKPGVLKHCTHTGYQGELASTYTQKLQIP